MNNSPKHTLSKDGSSTLYSKRFGQFYHNPNGAVSESKHVFFDAPGLTNALNNNPETLSIFEVGFGTGLNFLLLSDLYLSNKLSYPVQFYSVEAFPVDKETAEKFNFGDFLLNKQLVKALPNIFEQIKPGQNTFQPYSNIEIYLHLFYGKFDEFVDIEHQIDFIFQDAFSPEVNEELWSYEAFHKLASFSKHNTMLSTYCAATIARAAMAKAGWFIARAPGALGKREMTIASLNEEKLSSLKRVNEKRLIERLKSGEF